MALAAAEDSAVGHRTMEIEKDLSAGPHLLAGSQMMENVNCWQSSDLIFIIFGEDFAFMEHPFGFEESTSFAYY